MPKGSLESPRRFHRLRQIFASDRQGLMINELLARNQSVASLSEKMRWLEQVMYWLFQGEAAQIETRFKFMLKALDQNPDWKDQFRKTFTGILADARFLKLFTHVGFAVEHGLWGDILSRMMARITPANYQSELQAVFVTCIREESQVEALALLSDETLAKLGDLLFYSVNEQFWKQQELQSEEALLFLAVHIAHYGMSGEIRSRLPARDQVSRTSFFRLLEALQTKNSDLLESALVACESDIATVYASMENNGVSVDVVNRLETASAMLSRIREIKKIEFAPSRFEATQAIRQFLVAASRSGIEGRSIVGQIRRHFYLLSKKIVERNGHSGEHYIARNRAEFWFLFRSAVGGGLIVVAMTILKTLLLRLAPPPLILACGIWIVYAAGFLSMQFLNCTLATKIPSFTASRLAGLLKTVRKLNAHEFKAEVKLVLKSQGLALLGNLCGVIPFALFLNESFLRISNGTGLMDDHYAHHILHDLHPLYSFAIPLGALTGVQLWLSSVAGGWFENWIVFNRFPQAVQSNVRLRKVFGEAAAKKFADWLLKNSSGIATNVALGFLFGFTPLIGVLFAANWNGNHVTISTAGAAFALSAIQFQVSTPDAVFIGVGLFFIAVMNFAVSFGLALFIASSAQKMKFWRVLYYLRASVTKVGNIPSAT